MPHGLFLGSHLATVDRLDTAPVPPPDRAENDGLMTMFNRIRTNGLPKQDWSVVLPAKWRKSAEVATTSPGQEEERELTKEEKEADAKWENERVRYEAEIKAFDRVKFVTVSIGHSTVSVLTGSITITAPAENFTHCVRSTRPCLCWVSPSRSTAQS